MRRLSVRTKTILAVALSALFLLCAYVGYKKVMPKFLRNNYISRPTTAPAVGSGDVLDTQILTSDGVYLDTEAQTLTFGDDTKIVHGDITIDVSNRSYGLTATMIGGTLYIDPDTCEISTFLRTGIPVGTIRDPAHFSELPVDMEKLFVDDMPVTWIGENVGKRFLYIGDGLTGFRIPKTEAVPAVGTTASYHDWLAQLCGSQENYAYGVEGSTIVPEKAVIDPETEEPGDSILERYRSMLQEGDTVLVMGGLEDWSQGKELGTFEDTDRTTFYGAMKALCKGLIYRYPDAQICFFSTPQHGVSAVGLEGTEWEADTEGRNRLGYRLEDYVLAMQQVCDLYAIPFCSLTDAMPWTPETLSDGTYGTDGIHPNEEAHKQLAFKIAEVINGLATQEPVEAPDASGPVSLDRWISERDDEELVIALIGDSVTAGCGASDYSLSDEHVIDITYNGQRFDVHRADSAYSWAARIEAYVEQRYSHCDVVNNGWPSATTWMVSDSIDELLPEDCDIAIIQVGINSRAAEDMEALVTEPMVRIIQRLQKRGILPIVMTPTVIVDQMPEEDIGRVREHIIKACEETGVYCYDMYSEMERYLEENGTDPHSIMSDPLHPNDSGYGIIFELYRKLLEF